MNRRRNRVIEFLGQRAQRLSRKCAKALADRQRRKQARHTFQVYDRSLPPSTADESSKSQGETDTDSLTAVYFSCHRDYALLRLSLMSLGRFAANHLRNVYIYEDASNPFTNDERQALRAAAPVEIVTGPRVTGWGVDTLLGELNLFRRIAALPAAAQTNWVAKVDSDVLFLGERLFTELARADCDLFGQPYTYPRGITYTQGGCYFLRTSFLNKLVHARVERAMVKLAALLKLPLFHLPEDASVFQLAKSQGARVQYSEYYLPPARIPTFVPSLVDTASVIHFESGLGTHLREHMYRIGEHLKAA